MCVCVCTGTNTYTVVVATGILMCDSVLALHHGAHTDWDPD